MSAEAFDALKKTERQVLWFEEKPPGTEHPHTLISMENLARVLVSWDKEDRGESVNRQTLAQRGIIDD